MDISISQPHNWQWQLKNAIRHPQTLKQVLSLTQSEEEAVTELSKTKRGLPLRITPHYLSLMNPGDPNDPLRRQVIPSLAEKTITTFERRDPLGEEDHEVLPHLVHRYPDRVLLLVTDRCASYCRFCTRKRWVGQGPSPTVAQLDNALAYIAQTPQIKEVILSGGDALLLEDTKLSALLSRIRAISSVEIIRIATRMLAFAPMRITDKLVEILQRYHPIYIMSHFNHPKELDPIAQEAVLRLSNAGIPVLNQTVLLRHINDEASILTELFRCLTRLRARPYYLHQCDIAAGTSQFRVPLTDALGLIKQLRGHISGLCMPTFVVDIPGGFGKVPLVPNPIIATEGPFIQLKGFKGEEAFYPLD